jgi:preprotein translocase subunit SecF
VMINFLRYRTFTALSSVGLMIAFGSVALYRKTTYGSVYTYSVEFTGGTQALFSFDQPVDSGLIKQVIADKGWANPIVREFGKNEVLIRVKDVESDNIGLGERMRVALQEALPANTVTMLQTESIGSGIGADLWGKSARGMLLATILMLMYIAMRFWSFAFAAGAIVALIHDAFVMLAIFLFLDREISGSFVAALLTVLGYSINDTIVIFSQIREYMRKSRGMPLDEIVNLSLNHTLRRTILTSVSTGLPVLVMLIFGGEALRDFSLALLIGVIFGTYSSVYIASPVMMLLQPKD